MQKVTVDIFLSTIMPSLCVPKRLNTNPVVALLFCGAAQSLVGMTTHVA